MPRLLLAGGDTNHLRVVFSFSREIINHVNFEGGHLMFAVIFQAKMKQIDDEYANVAERMRHLALSEFGCIKFSAVTEGLNEIAISYWPDEEKILAWKRHSEHLIAQELGRERWYESYEVQICKVERQYHFPH